MASVKRQLDLGAGGANRIWKGYAGYGVDIVANQRPWLRQNKQCDLALDTIPYRDNIFDLVTAFDLLEHIPAVLYLYKEYDDLNAGAQVGHVKRNCMIELFNEIYRVLKPGGLFFHSTPGYHPDANLQSVWSDPTHCYVWTPDSAHHFSGDYYGQHDDYGHTSKFLLAESVFLNGHFQEKFHTVKPMEPPYVI